MKKILIFNVFLFICHSLFALNPSRVYPMLPAAMGLNAQVLKIKVQDSIELNSWFLIQSDLKRPFVIISNSDGGNMGYCLAQANAFFKEGYNVVLYDYRGFGESSDYRLNHNQMYYDEFADDLKSVISFTKSKFHTKSLVLYGISMGAIISDIVIQEDKSIKGGIFDSFPIDPSLVVKRIFEAKGKTVLLPVGAKQFADRNKSKLGISVLLFSGLKDNFTKSVDYVEFLKINKGSKLVTWNCDHIQCFYQMTKVKDGDLYMAEVNQYIKSLKFN